MATDKLKMLKKMDWIAYGMTLVVLCLVIFTRGETKPDFGIDFGFLPTVYSSFNAVTALLLVWAYVAIRKKNIKTHRNLIYAAIATSIIFLVLYVVYHYTTPETKFCKEGWVRPIYFFILITHIILAGAILPFILLTFNRAFLGLIDKHRRMARWVFPFWLYVAITGPIIFFMLYPCYNH